ncbi:MAG: D-glycero-beta-D-manno-heptose 1-phosphate adenylyltransferase [Alphaproteobacteria bacterium]
MTDRAPDLLNLLDNVAHKRVAVLGDIMLDRFVEGQVSRISPEAPIPVFAIAQETAMLGGAGNVARNVVALGGEAALVGIVGRDAAGLAVETALLDEAGITSFLVCDEACRTTEKTRYRASGQQMLRADREDTTPIEGARAEKVLAAFAAALEGAGAAVLSDYAKGVLSDAVLGKALAMANAKGVPVIVDPKRADFTAYRGATLIKPNAKEMRAAAGGTDIAAANRLRTEAGIESVLITLSEKGMLLVNGQGADNLPAHARDVFDVSGAGDTVAAALALGIAAGAAENLAARFANLAAGIVVGKAGTATVYPGEMAAALTRSPLMSHHEKILPRSSLKDLVVRWQTEGKKVGFTNGCFDLIHPGHLSLLRQARANCDHLVVGLNSDASVQRLKGPTRPVQDEAARAEVLAALSYVDAVTLFEEDTPLELIEVLLPDVIVKGADYTEDQVVGGDIVKAAGGTVFLAQLEDGFSTTNTVAKINQKDAP